MASVLVIEDDQRIRETLARSLTDAGHAVRTEATEADALQAVVGWEPDVVVLDLGPPDLDGADVLRMLRGVSTVPAIVATARDDDQEVVRLLESGADDYVALAREGRVAFSRDVDGGEELYTPVVVGAGDVVVLRARVPQELLTDGVATSWTIQAVLASEELDRSVTRPAASLAATSRALATGDPRARAEVTGPPEIAAVADAAAAVDVLIGNVFAHTPEGTPYAVAVHVDGDRAVLTVDDAGPGIPDPQRVLDRGVSAAGSSGLGLDIARSTARASGGDLHVSRSRWDGARVALDLPLAGPQP